MISIIIPTYLNHKGLVECLESVKKYTSGDYEVVVVANGAPEETRKLLMSAGCDSYDPSPLKYCPVKHIWFDQPLGFAKAVNEGIKASKGEYVVLLNDDCVLLPQPVNQWIELLQGPFHE